MWEVQTVEFQENPPNRNRDSRIRVFSPSKALLFIDRTQQNLHFYTGCVESTRYDVLRNSVQFEPEIRYMSYFALKVQFHQ